LIELSAGSLSALCFAFSWRALQRCRAIATATSPTVSVERQEPDAFEQRLAERESNAELNLARRNVKGLAQAAFTGGLALFFLALADGGGHQRDAVEALALGSGGGIACLVIGRRIGSLAESWRDVTNRRHRRQGVDQPERTG
jgi:hypothetical protein